MKNKKKLYLILAVVAIVIVGGVAAKLFAGGEFFVRFTSPYAEVGKELSVEIEGAKKLNMNGRLAAK